MFPTHTELIQQINHYGSNHIPFVCLVDFEMHRPYLSTLEELNPNEILFTFPGYCSTGHNPGRHTVQVELTFNPVSKKNYLDRFYTVKKELLAGNSFLTNLTVRTPIQINTSLLTIYHQAHSKYKIWFKDEWVCFSPETFIEISDQTIYAHPMKGTIDADLPHAANQILQDVKETAEHHTIVDLIRNDLNLVSTDVRVEKFRYLTEIKSRGKNLLQVSSKIAGTLYPDYTHHLGDILFKLLPAGSVSGAPKSKTVEIIKKTEGTPRGYYTGVCFYFDGSKVDSCVLIRFIEKTSSGMYYKSGGGITIHSLPNKEYAELNDKIYLPIF